MRESGFPWEELARLVTLQDPNTRVVLAGTVLLGIASGVVGTFVLLKRRAMVGDALSHAALPGLCAAFMILGSKDLFGLLFGALVSGLLGVLTIVVINQLRRVSDDAAIGIVLTVFFGIGICLSRIIQNTPTGMQAGLDSYIYGKAASMLVQDAFFIAVVSSAVVCICVLFFKELLLVCFDPDFGRTTGWPVAALDLFLMICLVATVMVGLQSVGVVLVIALLITPAAAARFWSDRLSTIVMLSAAFGGASALLGASLSALYGRLPTGPLIVIVAALIFALSAACAPRRGVIAHYAEFRSLQRKIRREHTLRAIFERLEVSAGESAAAADVPFVDGQLALDELASAGIPELQAARELRRLEREGLLERSAVKGKEASLRFTAAGKAEALRVVRNHRLWELYLINFAEIAPTHVDTSADRIEHVLPPETIRRLEEELVQRDPDLAGLFPASPHHMAVERGS